MLSQAGGWKLLTKTRHDKLCKCNGLANQCRIAARLMKKVGGEPPGNSPIHQHEISFGELIKTQLNFRHREILVALRVVLINLLQKVTCVEGGRVNLNKKI